MFDIVIFSVILVSMATVVIFWIFQKYRNQRYFKSLSGPSGLPYFGCLFQIDSKNSHFTFDTWAYEYGDIFYFSMLGRNCLVINSSEIARELYMHEPTSIITSGRAPTFAGSYVQDDDGVILTSFSLEWLNRRKITHQAVQSYGGGLRQIEKQVHVLLQSARQKLKIQDNKAVDPANIIDEFLFSNLEETLSGKAGNTTLQQLMKQLDADWNNLLIPSVHPLLSRFPFIRHFPCEISRRFHRILSNRQQIMDILQSTSENYPELSGIYQSLVTKVKEDEEKKEFKFTMNNVKMITHELIAAAYLTTSGTLKSILKIMVSRQDVQKKLQSEIDMAIGSNRYPLLSDRENCPYTEATILETLRYISHTPLTAHSALEDFVLKGSTIPKNCIIFVNVWHIHHSSKEWDEPYDFKPERFLDNDGSLLPATHPVRKRLMTFGVGKRSCIGEVLAKSRIFLFVASLMQTFTLVPPADNDFPMFNPKEMKPGIVLQPKEFSCKFISR